MKFVKKHYVFLLFLVWLILVIAMPFLFVILTPLDGNITQELAFRLGIIVSALSIGHQAYISLAEIWQKNGQKNTSTPVV